MNIFKFVTKARETRHLSSKSEEPGRIHEVGPDHQQTMRSGAG